MPSSVTAGGRGTASPPHPPTAGVGTAGRAGGWAATPTGDRGDTRTHTHAHNPNAARLTDSSPAPAGSSPSVILSSIAAGAYARPSGAWGTAKASLTSQAAREGGKKPQQTPRPRVKAGVGKPSGITRCDDV